MNPIKSFAVVSGLLIAFATMANAQSFIGSISIQEDPTQTGAYTASSLSMDISNYTVPFSGTGTFAAPTSGTVPIGTEAFVKGTTITGLSANPLTLDISDFVIIGAPGPIAFGSPGTTPIDRYDFELQTLTENNPSIGYFTGMGILTDTAGTYSPTSAELLLTFSGVHNYSFTLQVVPEPTTLSLAAVGFLGALALRRRRRS